MRGFVSPWRFNLIGTRKLEVPLLSGTLLIVALFSAQ